MSLSLFGKQRILRIVVLNFLIALCFVPRLVAAVTDYRTDIHGQADAFINPGGEPQIEEIYDVRLIAARLVRYGIGIVGTLFLAYDVYAGYLILTSGGQEEPLTKAKNTLRTAIIGIIVTLSAYSLTVLAGRIFDLTQEPSEGDCFGIEGVDCNVGSGNQNTYRNPDPLR